jgi:hypothetical protein
MKNMYFTLAENYIRLKILFRSVTHPAASAITERRSIAADD